MWIHFKAFLTSKDMDGRQHSARGVLWHPFHTQKSLHKSGLQMAALLPPWIPAFPPKLQGSDLANSKIWIHLKAFLTSKDMDGRQHSATGVLRDPYHTQMSLHKLWVDYRSLLPPQLPALPPGQQGSDLAKAKI